ncbi:DUF2889 domain-containing protein [Streptomyces sp. NPDC102441]|uniref:DUF2889 domain-containing protein n=1 Tax=Streptomyces sp. NPDC102441 TaxID=3366176 RepID=UPI0037FF5C86
MTAPAEPRRHLPPRRPDSVRRTVTVRMTPAPRWDRGIELAATGRDVVTRADGSSNVLAEARIDVRIDARGTVTAARTPGTPDLGARVEGTSVTDRFRARVVAPAALALGPVALEVALLDDLPVTRLITGYAMLRAVQAGRLPAPAEPQGGRRAGPPLNVCVGWAPGATADSRTRSNGFVLGPPVPAPPLAELLHDAADWHEEPAPGPDTMYRRRMLELRPDGGRTEIECYLRDSWSDDANTESSLHEYTVLASAAGEPAVLTELHSRPHCLPFPECPLAVRAADALVGTPLTDVDPTVRQVVGGPRGCTHLADTLRSMRVLPALLEALR